MLTSKNIREILKVEKDVRIFVHNSLSEEDRLNLIRQLAFKSIKANEKCDNQARVLAFGNTSVAYRINNELYLIPAFVKSMINNNDGKLLVWFDYPQDMKQQDLLTY